MNSILAKTAVFAFLSVVSVGTAFAEAGVGSSSSVDMGSGAAALPLSCPSVSLLNSMLVPNDSDPLKNLHKFVYRGMYWHVNPQGYTPQSFVSFLGVTIPVKSQLPPRLPHVSCSYIQNPGQHLISINSGDYYSNDYIFKGVIGNWSPAVCLATNSSECVFVRDYSLGSNN